jgi:hypothetical protein
VLVIVLVLVLESPSLSGTSTIFGMAQIEDSVGSVIDDEDDDEDEDDLGGTLKGARWIEIATRPKIVL